MYSKMCSYEKAEPYDQEALHVQRKVLGLDRPDYARSLGNLAGLYSKMGSYEKAEPLYQEAIHV